MIADSDKETILKAPIGSLLKFNLMELERGIRCLVNNLEENLPLRFLRSPR